MADFLEAASSADKHELQLTHESASICITITSHIIIIIINLIKIMNS